MSKTSSQNNSGLSRPSDSETAVQKTSRLPILLGFKPKEVEFEVPEQFKETLASDFLAEKSKWGISVRELMDLAYHQGRRDVEEPVEMLLCHLGMAFEQIRETE